MEKQVTRTDIMYILSVIFLLFCIVAAFFYGLNMGTNRTEAKYEAAAAKKQTAAQVAGAYDQSYLVSYYYTIYLPYQDFQKKWFDELSAIELRGSSVDPSSIMKELGKLADEKYSEAGRSAMPDSSPLLKDAQMNVLKSLKLFSDATKAFVTKSNSMSPSVLLGEIDKDPTFTEARNFALTAQKNYYDSILKWNQSVNANLSSVDLASQGTALSFTDWNSLNLNLKDDYIAGLLQKSKYFRPFMPQDVVYHVDDLIRSGQAKKLNADTIPQLIDILLGTGAVRSGDFLGAKSKWYGQETMPQLPFFSQPT